VLCCARPLSPLLTTETATTQGGQIARLARSGGASPRAEAAGAPRHNHSKHRRQVAPGDRARDSLFNFFYFKKKLKFPIRGLQFECIFTVTLALPYTKKSDGSESKNVPAIVKLCAENLRLFVEVFARQVIRIVLRAAATLS
jgi:hypothetical protein